MLDLNELQQLVDFADLGTLSKVAEKGHISTPSITRSMKNVEEHFGVPLFTRSKNRIELNDTGREAVSAARRRSARCRPSTSAAARWWCAPAPRPRCGNCCRSSAPPARA